MSNQTEKKKKPGISAATYLNQFVRPFAHLAGLNFFTLRDMLNAAAEYERSIKGGGA